MLRAYATSPRLLDGKMSLSSYLTKRPNSQYWQLRMMVPAAARPILRRREFTRSLRVTDKRAAENAAYPVIADWQARIAAASPSAPTSTPANMARPTETELEELALVVGYEIASDRIEALIKAKASLGTGAFDKGRVRQGGVISGVSPGRTDQAALGVICRGGTSSICGVASVAMPSSCM